MNTLEKICDDKRAHIHRNEHFIPQIVLEERAKLQPAPIGFCEAIRAQRDLKQPALIAEIKKASPSKGIIRSDFDPVQIAAAYASSGATCLSVLTDQPYFKGTDEDLEAVKNNTHIPVIRKDFMLTPYQIVESRSLGADCILLIMAALDDETATTLYKTATDLKMDVLIEIHDEDELNRALKLDPMMIGVNSRNLKTLEVNLQTAFELVQKIPSSILRVAESGISTNAQLQSLFESGYDAFLVGESLMREQDISSAVRKLLGKSPESV
jgi:indole-3-glycerol phosphate synthase